MTHSPLRRALLLSAAAAPFALTLPPHARAARLAHAEPKRQASDALHALERQSGGRLGVFALNTGTGTAVAHRANERFPICSTFKAMLAAAVLARTVHEPDLLHHRLMYTRGDLVHYSPTTEKHVAEGMTVAELCEATMELSDNTAANVLMKLLGGPSAVTAYARSIGNREFRLDRWEPQLNTAIPGDERDTSTPEAMARSLGELVTGEQLPRAQRGQFRAWLIGNKTGDRRIRAGVPAGWRTGDKTGTGDYGTANDLGIAWPPSREPIVLAVYHTHTQPDAKPNENIIAAATRIVVGTLA